MTTEFYLGTSGAHTSPPCTGIGTTYCLSSYLGGLKDWVILGLQITGEDSLVSDVARVRF